VETTIEHFQRRNIEHYGQTILMILKKEIEKLAEDKGVAKSTIDKDWVLGHFLDAIFSIPKCKESLVFKGGTCLKKCYFPDYRFSEDLDFTSINPDFLLDKKLLTRITKLVNERTDAPLYIQELKQLKHKDKSTGYSAIINFWGADHPRNQAPPSPERWTTSIKIEIILYETIFFPIEQRQITHNYSDKLLSSFQSIPCYSIPEVLSEKLRALIQRSYTAPRDFYDIWYLANNVSDLNWKNIVEAFHKKMAFKGLKFTGIDQMINEENDKRLQAAWANSLGHQIAKEQLSEYKNVKSELQGLFQKIFNS
ncbi:MAG: nucleotidyl transferase AbiEii/AbiGii toxin family protein, partial [Cytophagaceae bacterium]